MSVLVYWVPKGMVVLSTVIVVDMSSWKLVVVKAVRLVIVMPGIRTCSTLTSVPVPFTVRHCYLAQITQAANFNNNLCSKYGGSVSHDTAVYVVL